MAELQMNVEELVALGLSQEEAEAIVGSSDTQQGAGLPFPLMKISYDADLAPIGNFITNIVKEDGVATGADDLGTSIEIRVISDLAQHSYFNPTTNRIEVSSNIFVSRDSKKARDLKTGRLITDMKESNDKIKYNQILAALVRPTGSKGKFIPVIYYNKGAFLYTFNSCRQNIPNNGNISYVMTIETTKKKKGAITYFEVDTDTFKSKKLADTEILKSIKDVAAIAKGYKKWVDGVNSSAKTQVKQAKASDDISGEDEVPDFD